MARSALAWIEKAEKAHGPMIDRAGEIGGILKEMELAVYELAEAETAERRAHQLRTSASKRIASFHAEFKTAVGIARKPKVTAKPTAVAIGLRYSR